MRGMIGARLRNSLSRPTNIQYLEEDWAASAVELSDDEEREIRELGREKGFAGSPALPQFLT